MGIIKERIKIETTEETGVCCDQCSKVEVYKQGQREPTDLYIQLKYSYERDDYGKQTGNSVKYFCSIGCLLDYLKRLSRGGQQYGSFRYKFEFPEWFDQDHLKSAMSCICTPLVKCISPGKEVQLLNLLKELKRSGIGLESGMGYKLSEGDMNTLCVAMERYIDVTEGYVE